MDKKFFQIKHSEDPIPEKEIRQAIQIGIRRAAALRQPKQRGSIRKKVILSSFLVAALILTFIISPVSEALSTVPLIGSVYSYFHDLTGKKLEEKEMTASLNETVSSQGIDVTVTEAYFDGGALGISFKITGEVEKDALGTYSSIYEIFHTDQNISETIEMASLKETEEGLMGHITQPYPYNDPAETITVPLNFTRIGTTEGNWAFQLPFQQLPYQTISLKETRSDEENDLRIDFLSVYLGQATVSVNYTADFTADHQRNQVRLEFYNDQGEALFPTTNGIRLDKKTEGNRVLIQGREMILQPVVEETEYIDVFPKIAIEGEDPNEPLELEPLRINLSD